MSRPDRWRESRNALSPRAVTREFRDRCDRAALDHAAVLQPHEMSMLRTVTGAWALGRPVMKRDLERAAGVLGRLGSKP